MDDWPRNSKRLAIVYANALGENHMVKFLLWLILLVICWPLALLALVLYPIVWLLLLPFRLVGITVAAFFQFIKALFMLPTRILKA
jgi:hypothetical protein